VLLEFLLSNACFAAASALLAAANTAGLPFCWGAEAVAPTLALQLGPGQLTSLVSQVSQEMREAAGEASGRARPAQQQPRERAPAPAPQAAAEVEVVAVAAAAKAARCAASPEEASAAAAQAGKPAGDSPRAGRGAASRQSSSRRYSSVEALLYAVPRPPAHRARRPSHAGNAALAGRGALAEGGAEPACVGMVWHVLT
jgi:hypothetical protein